MSELFSYSEAWLHEHHALHTAREIDQQPRLWRQLHDELSESQGYWKPFCSRYWPILLCKLCYAVRVLLRLWDVRWLLGCASNVVWT